MPKKFVSEKREVMTNNGARRLFMAGLNSLTKKLLNSGPKNEKPALSVKIRLLA